MENIIYAYTRKQAIEDGEQVDISSTAKEAGIRFPVFLTRRVFDTYVTVPPNVSCQDEAGRLWDIVSMLRFAIKRGRSDGDRIDYSLYVRNDNRRPKLVKLVAVCGAHDMDAPEPAITVMMPGGRLTPKRAAGFTPVAQPNAASPVWRLPPAIFVYFAWVSGYNTRMSLVKSKQRVADHGEVFTPTWMVEAMLDLVKGETERIDSRFLEPACGDGNFLAPVLRRKLAAVEIKFGKSDFEKRHYALLALMCIYGIELLPDNIAECRANLLEIFAEYLNLDQSDDLFRAAFFVLSQNLVHGDALTMRTHDALPITFAEWGYLGKGRFQRRDFRFDSLTHSSSFSAEGSLFAHLGMHEIFKPAKTYPPMTVSELVAATPEAML